MAPPLYHEQSQERGGDKNSRKELKPMNILAMLFAGEKLGDILEERVRERTKPGKLEFLRRRRGLPLQRYEIQTVTLLLDKERLQKLEAMGAAELLNDMIADGAFLQEGTFPFEEKR